MVIRQARTRIVRVEAGAAMERPVFVAQVPGQQPGTVVLVPYNPSAAYPPVPPQGYPAPAGYPPANLYPPPPYETTPGYPNTAPVQNPPDSTPGVVVSVPTKTTDPDPAPRYG